MPNGIVVMHWDERKGAEIVSSYPEGTELQERTLMQLYSQHEYSGEIGLITLQTGTVNIVSYYTGQESSYYIILMLNLEEDGDIFEEGLADIGHTILEMKSMEEIQQVIPTLYQRVAIFPTLNEEQKLGLFFSNELKKMIFKRLREEIAISKSEIMIWLRDYYHGMEVDIENVIDNMIKLELGQLKSIKGISSEMLFLDKDLMMLRIPPEKLVLDPVDHHLPELLKDSYIASVRAFFEQYIPTEEDSLHIIEKVILNPETYEILKLLRAAIVTRNDLEKLKKKGVEHLNESLSILWEAKMINVLKDSNDTEYFALVSDFTIDKMFPRYSLKEIRRQYKNKIQNPKVLLSALGYMREAYLTNISDHKKKKIKS